MSISATDDRFFLLMVMRNRHTTAVEARNRLEQVRGVKVSSWTMRRRLYDDGRISTRCATGSQQDLQYLQAQGANWDWSNEQCETVL